MMKRLSALHILLLIAIIAAGCTPADEPPATVAVTETAQPSPTIAASPTDAPTETAAPQAAETPQEAPTPTEQAVEPGDPEASEIPEAILILTPGVSSRITSPVRVAGEAAPTFEQSLTVRIITIDGETLATEPAMIEAEMGQRGPFETELSFDVSEETQGWIQVFAGSPRDGGVTHLSAVGLMLAPDGEANILEGQPHEERIQIESPTVSEIISGGEVLVRGRGLASFEQTLVVELQDEEGRMMAMTPLIVDAPDLGEWGVFEATLSYEVSETMPARVVVYDPSPAFGGDVHVASVEVWLE